MPPPRHFLQDIDNEEEQMRASHLVKLPIETILSMQQQRQDENERKEKDRKQAIKERSLVDLWPCDLFVHSIDAPTHHYVDYGAF